MEKGNRRKKFPIKKYLMCGVLALTVAVFPVFFLYGQNAAEADPVVALRCVGLFLLEGIVAYLLGLILTCSAPKGALTAGVILLLSNNFKFIETIVRSLSPSLKYWHALFLCILVAGHIIWLLKHFCKEELAKTFSSVLALVMGGLCVMNLCIGIPGFLAYQDVVRTKKMGSVFSGEQNTDLPNFYYLIFDEYGGYDATQKYYGKDGSEDIAFFRDLGFNVSEDSYSATWLTVIETANLFHLDYIASAEQPITETNKLRWNAPFFQLLREKGYDTKGIGVDSMEYGLTSAYDTKANQAETMEGKSFWDLLMDNTVIYPALQQQDIYTNYRKEIIKSLKFFIEDIDTTKGGQFYLLHVNCPHMPFVFDAEGRALSLKESANWTDKEIYLGQREYMTWWMKEIAENLVERDPNSIIVLQSDHGFRGGVSNLVPIPEEYGCNILNNVYFCGKELDIQGKTSINTLRTILNELFCLNYEMVIPPEGIFTK